MFTENLLCPNLNNKRNNDYLFSKCDTPSHTFSDIRKTHFLEILPETKANKSKICEFLKNYYNEKSKGAKGVKFVEMTTEEIDKMNVLEFIYRFDK